MYWHNNLGIVNQAFNELLSYEELEAERIILKENRNEGIGGKIKNNLLRFCGEYVFTSDATL
jgi:hypothetical protein